jgi:hypothetical protein
VVITDPRTSERRRVKEAWIRVVDMVVYLFALAGGVFALLVPPNTIKTQLEGWEWLAIAWGCMLVIAGAFGFIGRLTRIWLIEAPGAVLGIAGGLVYALILGVTAYSSTTAWVAFCIVAIATLELWRRYLELQIFTTDPGVRTLADRLRAALNRRTANTAGEHR